MNTKMHSSAVSVLIGILIAFLILKFMPMKSSYTHRLIDTAADFAPAPAQATAPPAMVTMPGSPAMMMMPPPVTMPGSPAMMMMPPPVTMPGSPAMMMMPPPVKMPSPMEMPKVQQHF